MQSNNKINLGNSNLSILNSNHLELTRSWLLAALLLLTGSALAQNNPAPFIDTNYTRGDNLLVLRIAISSTGEHTQEVGGVAMAKARINAIVANMNEVYGREYSVRFELIPNNDLLIFSDASTDPWPNVPAGGGCVGGSDILDVQPMVIDNIIGTENYEISHVFADNSLGGGCAGSFKIGVSTSSVDVVRHELGHQFSQSHTVNEGPARSEDWAYELGKAGRSIQGGNSVANAHAASFHQLVEHLNNFAVGIGNNVPTGNNIPTINAGPDRIIPFGTPFALTAVSTDSDSADKLNYVWDQLDRGIPQIPPLVDFSQGPLFSRLLPTPNPTRTFPQLANVLSNIHAGALENLPTGPREINLRVTVNDNHMINYQGTKVPASGVNSDDVKLTVANSGPFQITNPNMASVFSGGDSLSVNWDVAGTNSAPISTANVKISLSTDSGMSFPIVLASSTPNDGSHMLNLPNIETTQARLKVEAIDNVYFDISNSDVTINQNPALPGIVISNTGANTLVNETNQIDTYTIALLKAPTGTVTIELKADSQIEISQNGTKFSNSLMIALNDTNPTTITVRGKYDTVLEGAHFGTVTHLVAQTSDSTNYPVGLAGKNLSVNISDAQLPPVVGVDFDSVDSTDVPKNWVKFSSTIGQSATNIPLDDGTPTNIGIVTNSPSCGIGGCSFDVGHNSGSENSPKHIQNLESMGGVAVSQLGPVTVTWNGLTPQTKYRVFVFAHYFLGGTTDQTVTITGDGSDNPAPFVQTVSGSIQVNDQLSSNKPLPSFAKEVTSSVTGTIDISINAEKETWLTGLAIQPIPMQADSIFKNGFE